MKNAGMKKYLKIMLVLVFCMVVSLPVIRAKAQKTTYSIHVNRTQNVVTIYKKDAKGSYTVPVKAMVCSVGMNNRTPKGIYHISDKYRWRQLFYGTYGQYATRICGNILFHSVGYDKKDPATLQNIEYNKLGTSASHGCVRLTVEDAKWIYHNCKRGTEVVIYDSKKKEPLEKPQAVKIPSDNILQKWDPTDTNNKNPWRKIAPKLQITRTDLEASVSKKADLLNMASAVNFKGQKVKVTVMGDYDLTTIGCYTVTFCAVDYLGNKTEKTVKIRVGDTIAPVITPIKQDGDVTITLTELQGLANSEEGLTEERIATWLKQYVVATDQGKELSGDNITVDGIKALFDDYKKYMLDSEFKFKEKYMFRASAKDAAGNVSKKREILILRLKDDRFTKDGLVTM